MVKLPMLRAEAKPFVIVIKMDFSVVAKQIANFVRCKTSCGFVTSKRYAKILQANVCLWAVKNISYVKFQLQSASQV